MLNIPNILQNAIKFDKSYFPIPIRECHEKLVDFKNIAEEKKLPVQFARKSPFTSTYLIFFIREGVVQPFIHAIQELYKKGYAIKIEYMYRRFEDQKKAYINSLYETKQKYPNMENNRQKEIAGIYVAATLNTSAHLSGAAIDVVLLDKNNYPVDMGAPYLHSGEESISNYKKLLLKAKKNRTLLISVMEKNGFANYPFEYWHFSMGDKIAARIQNKKYAIYGPVIFDPKTKIQKPVQNGDVYFSN